ncbi:hypothetical protein C0Q70_05943 [Pomacea canaliculata]|uniref:Cadherin domain-containing protein n=1 Tax=Pomacea canaliculata TaxID=400727 RepID=A0A2T7PMK7_POMCA|nr:hypothetical protein C0Q70_05943 [Pomacea canaliculata]
MTEGGLDRETKDFYRLNISARDDGDVARYGYMQLTISITDVNDEPPTFSPSNYMAEIKERADVGTAVIRVEATDGDIGDNAQIVYTIQSDPSGQFVVDDQTGVVRTKTSPLQCNRVCQSAPQCVPYSCLLTVVARDRGLIPLEGRAYITVAVIDENDHDPVIPSILLSLILSQDMQHITEDNGTQATSIGESVVIATTGSKFGKQKVTINVLDLNDNTPRFTTTTLETVVMENWPVGNNIFLAGAVDADSGLNSKLEYTLRSSQDTSGIFGIDQHKGIISLRKPTTQLNRSTVTLTVTVKDSGVPQRTATIDVTVKIQDVNDHTPVFPRNVYSISVLESKQENEIVMKFVATDIDQGRNGELVYTIIRGNENKRFGIFPDGTLYIAHALDRETRDMYSLTIQVRDCGDMPRGSVANVTIYVLDANDNSPEFSNTTYVFSVPENRPAGTYVGKVQAADNDVDQNAELTYSLVDGNTNFSIDYVTGAIYTRRSFDREYVMETSSVEFYSFDALAADGGTPKLRGRSVVKVYVTDVNDNPPVFARALFSTVVSENAAKDYNVIKMTATDADNGANAVLTYAIIAGNSAGKLNSGRTTGS